MTGQPVDVEILADHTLLLAIPAFAPAIVVVAGVVIVRRDCGTDAASGDDEAHSENPGVADQDGPP